MSLVAGNGVSASGGSLDAAIDPRLGRCPYFMFVDTETMRSEAVTNTSQYASSGAGILAAQTITSKGASVVLTGNVGPNANQALSGAGIRVDVVKANDNYFGFSDDPNANTFGDDTDPNVGGYFSEII